MVAELRPIRDVLIIGAGLAGSALAVALASRGWDVMLAERDRLPRHKVCGEFLSPEAQSSLRTLGLAEEVARLDPVAITQARLVSQRGVALEMSLPGDAWGLSRHALDHALAMAAARRGAELWLETTVLRYKLCDGVYLVHLRRPNGEDTVAVRAVIAAGGRHTLAALPPASRALPRTQQAIGVKAHFVNVWLPAAVELYFFPGGYAGISPVEGGRVNLCLMASYAAFAQTNRQATAMLAAAAHWNPGLGRRLAGAKLLAESVVAVAPVDVYRPATPWAGVACVGDSAAMIPPLCGDGMAMALRSAELCAPLADAYLRGTLSLTDWAKTYQQAWHAEFDRRLAIGRLLQRVLSMPGGAEGLLWLGRSIPGLANYFVRATRGHDDAASRKSR
jgi:flavin-dependent dehydrogenase